ncbi:MAG: sugar kinase [Verrucomicrobia bacterium]|nr:MAG: sugar kinase [Verrucomicrobiota bacterium]
MSPKLAIGIDFGGTSVKPGVISGKEIISRLDPIPTREHRGADSLLAAVFRAVASLREKHPGVSALGAGLPGIIDGRNGLVRELSNVPGWRDIPLAALLRKETGLPSIIENDANAMTFAEWRFGAGRNQRNVICMTLGTGVGGGLILDGKLFRGSQLGAGEIGQMIIEPHGVPGHYGNFGALEKYVGNRQIVERAQERYAAAGRAYTLDELTPLLLEKAALKGDVIAKKLWEDLGFEIGIILTNIVWLLNPDRIVIGGGVAKAGELVFGPIKHTIRERTSAVFHEHLEVIPAELGNDGGMIGSAALAVEAAEGRPS